MENQGNEYDKYEGKNVIFTLWDNLKQYVKIKKNDKEKKWLEVIDVTNKNDIHYLKYYLIGVAVVKIEFDKN
tara:strand:- start:944 stop:1159 length:216 start_codon:yes stop_codon:yes gene_type:complete